MNKDPDMTPNSLDDNFDDDRLAFDEGLQEGQLDLSLIRQELASNLPDEAVFRATTSRMIISICEVVARRGNSMGLMSTLSPRGRAWMRVVALTRAPHPFFSEGSPSFTCPWEWTCKTIQLLYKKSNYCFLSSVWAVSSFF